MAVAPVIWCVPYRRGAGSKLTILIINVFPLIVMPFGKKIWTFSSNLFRLWYLYASGQKILRFFPLFSRPALLY